jgi:ATP-binding cassette subfamily B protein
MKSSRQRFAEFRSKMRLGLIDQTKLNDGRPPDERPYTGGPHGRGPERHVFKLKKATLLAEYKILLKGYYGWLSWLITLVLIDALLALIAPAVLKMLFDYVAPHKPLPLPHFLQGGWIERHMPAPGWPELNLLVAIIIVTTLITVANSWIRLLSFQQIQFRLAGTLRQRLNDHLLKLSLARIADYKTGGIVSRIMGDVDGVVGGVQNAIIQPINAFFRISCVLAILLTMDWRLCVVTALFAPPILVVHLFMFRRLRPLWRNIADDRSTISARLTDTFSGIRVVRSFRRERSESKEFGASQGTMIRKQRFTALMQRALGTGWAIFVPAMGVVVIWYGGARVLSGSLKLGDLVLFQGYMFMLLGPITSMIESIQNLQQNLASMDRMLDVLGQPMDMPDSANAKDTRHASGHLQVQDVSFAYTADRPVLRNVTLDIPAGTTMAIVGPSGSGKTTLVNLVARFFDVSTGRITLDGVDIRDIQREAYRALFAMVLQDVYLFDGTVLENIAYGRRHATRDEIIAAAQQANAHEFISAMEKGYDTHIGERGGKLSGGQKQRISIARAILADPTILILDEATSALDTRSEKMIQGSLNALMSDRTTLVIAHRLSTIVHADCIVVLDDGKVIEQGTHEELLEKRGFYYNMFTQQFERHRDPMLERIEWENV